MQSRFVAAAEEVVGGTAHLHEAETAKDGLKPCGMLSARARVERDGARDLSTKLKSFE